MLQAAEYDAVVSITKAAPLYGSAVPAPDGACPDAAADQAAHDVLVPDAASTSPVVPGGGPAPEIRVEANRDGYPRADHAIATELPQARTTTPILAGPALVGGPQRSSGSIQLA